MFIRFIKNWIDDSINIAHVLIKYSQRSDLCVQISKRNSNWLILSLFLNFHEELMIEPKTVGTNNKSLFLRVTNYLFKVFRYIHSSCIFFFCVKHFEENVCKMKYYRNIVNPKNFPRYDRYKETFWKMKGTNFMFSDFCFFLLQIQFDNRNTVG